MELAIKYLNERNNHWNYVKKYNVDQRRVSQEIIDSNVDIGLKMGRLASLGDPLPYNELEHTQIKLAIKELTIINQNLKEEMSANERIKDAISILRNAEGSEDVLIAKSIKDEVNWMEVDAVLQDEYAEALGDVKHYDY